MSKQTNTLRFLLLLLVIPATIGWITTVAFTSTNHDRRKIYLPHTTAMTPTKRQPWQGGKTPLATTRLFMDPRAFNSTSSLGRSHGKLKSSTELSVSFADVSSMGYKIYCDLDGVLVDFEKGVHNLLKTPSSQLIKGTMWKHIARANAFYENLDWTQDGRLLWEEIRHLRPNILTGVPYPKSSRIEKYNWCKRELGLDDVHHVDMAAGYRDHISVNGNIPKEGTTNVITCWSNNKHRESNYGAVLIDDRECARDPWEQAGGLFIHHVDAKTTLKQLRERGIL